MRVALPFPRSLSLLLILLPFVLLAGFWLARRLTKDRALSITLTPGIAVAGWLLAVHAAGLATRSFLSGLAIGTAGVAALAIAYAAYQLKTRAWVPSVREVRLGSTPLLLLTALITTGLVGEMAFGWLFHDEHLYTGHLSISSQILNDVYPPRHLSFPDVELRYHYGFDLFAACLTALFRVRIDEAIDISTVLFWAYTVWLLWTLGAMWFGRSRGLLTVVLVLFAGGLPVCADGSAYGLEEAISVCSVQNLWVMPPMVSSFFQRPWALALPLAVATIIVFTERQHERPVPRLVVLWLLGSALSLGHVVLFVTILPSVLASELWWLYAVERRRFREGIPIVLVGAATAVTALAIGGFFTGRSGEWASQTFELRVGVVDGFQGSLMWNLQSFGLLLPLALVGAAFVPRRARLFIGLLLVGSLTVLNTVRYKLSWDIVKFGVVAILAMGLAATAAIDRVLVLLSGPGFARRSARVGVGFALTTAAAAGGLSLVLFFQAFPAEATSYFNPNGSPMARSDVKAAGYLRKNIQPGELVFRREDKAPAYAQWAGLPVPWLDWAVGMFGFPQERLWQRQRLLRRPSYTPEAYWDEGIRWFVIDEHDGPVAMNANRWIAESRAIEAARYGNVRVVRLKAPHPAR